MKLKRKNSFDVAERNVRSQARLSHDEERLPHPLQIPNSSGRRKLSLLTVEPIEPKSLLTFLKCLVCFQDVRQEIVNQDSKTEKKIV